MRKHIGELLVDLNVVTQEDITAALDIQKTKGGMLGLILVDMKVITTDDLVEVLGYQAKNS